jgi:diguanylate cyclase (GGDEF)-like protein
VLTSSLRASDVVARIAGDEFALLLPETSGEGAQVVVAKLRERLSAALAEAGHSLTFSIAIVGFQEGGISLDAMLRQADALMVDAKRHGPGATRYHEYEHPPVSLV